ncbi:hypothetical protein GCM10023094_12740 [Rhodococcus olei]|uniref:HTH luxR-type domain-containing protein n=1 Tax=Rhodococcus olei TaxID=2161675 RepID=A0ABP8NZ25_9NOCA
MLHPGRVSPGPVGVVETSSIAGCVTRPGEIPVVPSDVPSLGVPDIAPSIATRLDFDAAIAYALGEPPPSPSTAAGPSAKATKREREVAELIAERLTNKEIAARLTISPRTAQGHVEHLLTKLGFASRAQIAAWITQARNENS